MVSDKYQVKYLIFMKYYMMKTMTIEKMQVQFVNSYYILRILAVNQPPDSQNLCYIIQMQYYVYSSGQQTWACEFVLSVTNDWPHECDKAIFQQCMQYYYKVQHFILVCSLCSLSMYSVDLDAHALIDGVLLFKERLSNSTKVCKFILQLKKCNFFGNYL